MFDKSRLEIKRGSYAVGGAAALTDLGILPKVQMARRQISARTTAFDKKTADRKIPSGKFHVSRKLDGEFSVLAWDGSAAILVNPGGTVRAGLPLLDEAASVLKNAGIQQALVAGELYVRHPEGARTRVHDVSRAARKPESDAALESLCFGVFDLLEIDEAAPGSEFVAEVWPKIVDLFGGGDRVSPVEAFTEQTSAQILEHFETWVEEDGAEGVVARSDEAGNFKIKLRHTFDVAVIGFAEGIDDRVGMLHDLLLGIVRKDGTIQVLGRVGGGFSDDQRRDLLSDFRDLVVESEYAEVNSDRVAYEMVRPEKVVEISCLDLVAQTTRGGSIDRMVLEWDEKASTWRTARRLPLCSVISPQFERLREDKSVNPADVAFSQLTDLVEIEQADSTAEDLALPKSEVISREVVVKELKGKKMVRKLILWKTNKEDSPEDYPAWVAHLTDFSPNRKDPMKREIRVSNSEEQIKELYEALKKKFFVGGWKTPG